MNSKPARRRAQWKLVLMFVGGLSLGVLMSLPSLVYGQERIAFVIGNGAYSVGRLSNPGTDARLIAATLREIGFHVIEGYDLNRARMQEAVREFGQRLSVTKGIGLFYYAGHAIHLNGENYLVPIGANILREDEIEYEAFSFARVLSSLQYAGNSLNIAILDACRNNPFRGIFRSPNRGLAGIAAPGGTLIAYATAPYDVASDNGAYARSLARHMKRPGLAIESVFRLVAKDIAESSARRQIPWYQSSIVEEFSLVSSLATTSPRKDDVQTTMIPPPTVTTRTPTDVPIPSPARHSWTPAHHEVRKRWGSYASKSECERITDWTCVTVEPTASTQTSGDAPTASHDGLWTPAHHEVRERWGRYASKSECERITGWTCVSVVDSR